MHSQLFKTICVIIVKKMDFFNFRRFDRGPICGNNGIIRKTSRVAPPILSIRMLIYNLHGDSASIDECRNMIDKVCFEFLQSYVYHKSLFGTVYYTNTVMNILFAIWKS